MLVSLTITNVVLIDRLTVKFENGFCALTGETGAGKSILLDSLGLCLGARSESGLVRKDSDQALVSAVFDLPDGHPVFAILAAHGLEAYSPLILRRSIQADGKSRAFVNDHPVSVSLLREIGEHVIEIHGQFDTQTLLNPKTHGDLLDEYAQTAILRADVEKAWVEWQTAKKSYETAQENLSKAKAEESYLVSAYDQLCALDPKEGEEERLATLRQRLMRREQTLEGLATIKDGFEKIQSTLAPLWRVVDRVGQGYDFLPQIMNRIESEVSEGAAQIEGAFESLQDQEETLSTIDDRLFALKAQARKHACRIDELPTKRDELALLLKGLQGGDLNLQSLKAEIEDKKNLYQTHAVALSNARQKAGQKLQTLMARELAPLKLEKARFEVEVAPMSIDTWGRFGMDHIQFLVATNAGAKAGPLNKIASGGELARFMLALKVVLAELGSTQTLIFDEVDSGIGGATAGAVGERLAKLARKRQILVVTHAPQVAACADYHWIVEKTGRTNPTTKVIPLITLEQREQEIARMLAGTEITKEARAAALKLLEKSAA